MLQIFSQRESRFIHEPRIFGIDDLLLGGAIAGGAASLFGGSGKPKSTSTLSPNQQEVSNSLADFLLGKMNKKGVRTGGLLENPQNKTAKLDPLYGNLRNLLSSFYSPAGQLQGSGALDRALSSQPSYALDPTTTQNYLDKNLYQPALSAFDQYVAPRIKESFANPSSAYNSRMSDALTRTLENITNNLNAQAAGIVQGNQQLEAQLAESQANRNLQAASLPASIGVGLASANAPFQAYRQQKVSANSPAQNPFFPQALNYLNNSQLGFYQPQNPFSNAIGGGVQGLALMKALQGFGGGQNPNTYSGSQNEYGF